MPITEEEMKQDIRLAKQVVNKTTQGFVSRNSYDKYRPFWAATQNLNYIRDLIKASGKVKNAFTILGTSENVFELINCDAENIWATDINPFAKYIYFLKKAAIRTLDVKEYISFLLEPSSKDFFNERIFEQRVIQGFSCDEQLYLQFWIELFHLFDKDQILDRFTEPVFKLTRGQDRVRYCRHLQRKNYESFKEKLDNPKVEIYQKDALELLESISDIEFDWIDITNILLFVLQTNCANDRSQFNDFIKRLGDTVQNRLGEDGIFIIDYMFRSKTPKEYLKEERIENNPFASPNDKIYKAIAETLVEYFDIIPLTYRSMANIMAGSQDSSLNDRLILAKTKNKS